MPNVLTVEGASKTYEPFVKPAYRLFCALFGRRPTNEGFHALHEVSFTVKRGEAFAVIGQNGAGKSTLLQIIVGTVFPTTGHVIRPKRVTNLLEIGSGFNQSYSGRENIFLNAALHGMSQKETLERLDEIIAFADIGEFIDRPVNTYSAGMYLRLAFGIAVSIEPDLIVIDEALAVGDIFFQQKCFARLRALKERGTAILLVTHSMGDAQQFCDRGLILDHGRPIFLGSAKLAVQRYLSAQCGEVIVDEPDAPSETPNETHSSFVPDDADAMHSAHVLQSEHVPLDQWPDAKAFVDISGCKQVSNNSTVLTALAITDTGNRACGTFLQGDFVRIFMEFELAKDIEVPGGGVLLLNRQGLYVHGKSNLQMQHSHHLPRNIKAGQRLRYAHEVRLGLEIGDYTLELALGCVLNETYDRWSTIACDETDGQVDRLCVAVPTQAIRVVGRRTGNPSALLHYGIADLEVNQVVSIR
jgi:lipopolysaccharide transport system ATP-binding protein